MATYSQQQMAQAYMDQSRQDLHVVKCVVVGDTGTGKTRLICARAVGNKYSLTQLMVTHVPTVWAIDHYRKDREALEQSWCTVDNIRVSLRLWDTFGYHDKDRRFAYGRADVILLTFSLTRPRTLRNVVHHWYPEIRRLCPGVPIVLCGCQADLRYFYRTPEFESIDKGPFFREITDADVITPEQGREVAKQISACYYETSVLDHTGVHEMFQNVVRAALTWKRDKHFWNLLGGLKRMSRPLPQEPFRPPRPPPPEVQVPPANHLVGANLLENEAYCDVIFVVQGVCIQAHRSYLVAANPVFEALFLADLSHASLRTLRAKNKKHKMTDVIGSSRVEKDTLGLLDNEEIVDTASICSSETAESSSCTLSTTSTCASASSTSVSPSPSTLLGKFSLPKLVLEHSAFASIELQHCQDVYHPGEHTLQTVVTLHDNITATAFQQVLYFLYTGRPDPNLAPPVLQQVKQAAQLIGLSDLVDIVNNILNVEEFLNHERYVAVETQRNHRMRELLINRGLLSDVLFQVDDGAVAAHKVLLMARCEVMAGMFSYNFRESSAKVIHFPGVSRDTFVALQDYLYTGSATPHLQDLNCLELIELANRLCLERLLALTQQCVIRELSVADEWRDIAEDVLMLLEPAQLHNACQLTDWCLWYLSTNYTTVYKKFAKAINSLRPENQIHLARNRWPPLWFLKEVDYYEKCLIEAERQQKPALRTYIRAVERRNSDDFDSGCLGFCSRKNRKNGQANVNKTIVA